MSWEFNKRKGSFVIIMTFCLIIILSQGREILKKREYDYIKNGPGVSQVKMLSDYFEDLKGTPMDTRVYVLKGKEKGGNALILGGTHGNEIAGVVSAIYMIENVKVEKGTLFIIPRANESAASTVKRFSGDEDYLYISKNRKIRIGARRSNIIDHWPQKNSYRLKENIYLREDEARNLNRVYPGKRSGNNTEKLAFGVAELVRKEYIDMTFDLHEGRPRFGGLNSAIVSKEAMDIALETVLELEFEEFYLRVEGSGPGLHGIIHNELPKVSNTKVVLLETVNTAQGPMTGKVNNNLYLTGEDPVYAKLKKMGKTSKLYRPYTLNERVARHVTSVEFFLESLGNFNERKKIVLEGLPPFEDIKNTDIKKLF